MRRHIFRLIAAQGICTTGQTFSFVGAKIPTKGLLLWEARSGSHERIPSGPGSATNTRCNQARIWPRYQCQIQSGQDPAPLLMPDPIRPRLGSAPNARSNHAKTWLRYQCQIRWEAISGSHERIPFVGAKIWFPRKGFLV